MAWYTIGEVAQLCDITPVTLRAWQRRYDLLKPQRTDGGHRLFTESDIERIREIKRWVDTGVQVSKVKKLLIEGSKEQQQDWQERQEEVLRYLQSGRIDRLRQWLKESTRHYPARTLVNQLITPLRQRLAGSQSTFCAMLGILDGVLINTIALILAASRKKPGHDALVVGWNVNDITPLWLEGGSPANRAGGWMCWHIHCRNCSQTSFQNRHCWCGVGPFPRRSRLYRFSAGRNRVTRFVCVQINGSLTSMLRSIIL